LLRKFTRRIHPALKITILYLTFSLIWIITGDELVAQLAGDDADANQHLQNLKGVTFVVLSGSLLFFTAFRYFKNLQETLDNKASLLQKLKALNEATTEGIIDYDFRNDTAILNDQMKMFMDVPNNVIKNFRELHSSRMHPEDRQMILDKFDNYLNATTTKWYSEYRYKIKKEYRNILSQGFILRDKDGQPIQMIYILKDITEVKKSQEKLNEQQVIFRKSLALSVIDAQETERNRWALELHDNICQMLAVSKLYLEIGLNKPNNTSVLLQSKAIVEDAINEIRTISYNIKPPQFELLTLGESIRILVSNIKRFQDFEFIMDFNEVREMNLRIEHKLMIYRVIQEQLNNILKYAAATEIFLSIAIDDGRATVYIQDDGIGFDPEKIKNGIGLTNIRSRLQAFSGNLTINSAPGKGCELIAVFNLEADTI
jgi:two-component system, NarL family, sensor histidine kinase UhpB